MSNVFDHALAQLDQVLPHLDKPDSKLVDQLKTHDAVIEKDLQVIMDDGSTKAFKAFRAQHNRARGPYKGGIRYSNHVSVADVKALSMWMSWKCAIAGIPYGGGKGGVIVDPAKLSQNELARLSHQYGQAFSEDIGVWKDIPGPDLGTNESVMSWIRQGYESATGLVTPGIVTGKPLGLDGIHLRTEATGRGGFYILEALAKAAGLTPQKTSLAIQGLGNVGYWLARYATDAGYRVVALSDSRHGVYHPQGLDPDQVLQFKKDHGSLESFSGGEVITNKELLELKVDVLAPAAIENVITETNAGQVKAKYLLELANGPTTPKADQILHQNGTILIADVLANSGGVTVSYFEWAQNLSGYPWDKEMVFPRLEKLMHTAFDRVWQVQQAKNLTGRQAAYVVGVGQVLEAMRLRGLNAAL